MAIIKKNLIADFKKEGQEEQYYKDIPISMISKKISQKLTTLENEFLETKVESLLTVLVDVTYERNLRTVEQLGSLISKKIDRKWKEIQGQHKQERSKLINKLKEKVYIGNGFCTRLAPKYRDYLSGNNYFTNFEGGILGKSVKN